MGSTSRRARYVVGAGLLLGVYAVTAVWFAVTKDFDAQGPLSRHQPDMLESLGLDEDDYFDHYLDEEAEPDEDLEEYSRVSGQCWLDVGTSDVDLHVVAGDVDGQRLYACYRISTGTGSVLGAGVFDANLAPVRDVDVLKAAGAWPYIGVVKTEGELLFGGVGMGALLVLGWRYYRVPRPAAPRNAPWWQSAGLVRALSFVPVVGWVGLWALPNVSRARKTRAAYQIAFGIAAVVLFFAGVLAWDVSDPWGGPIVGLISVAWLYAIVGGRSWLAPPGFDAREGEGPSTTPPPPSDGGEVETSQTVRPTGARDDGPLQRRQDDDVRADAVDVQPPEALPTFADLGGMDALKTELDETFGLLLAHAGKARHYRITWNGVLLHGPPGVGKTFLAKAVAGEYGLSLLHVSTGDLVSAYRGDSAQNVARVFRTAARNVPCVLFFDEFDSVAQRRDDVPDQEARRSVNQLLQSLEEHRPVHELVVMAATNHLDGLDPAVTRAGRFDRHVRIDLPDQAARSAIFAAQLRDRPIDDDLDLDDLARRAAGMTPAAIAQVVEAASLAAFRQAAEAGEVVHITTDHLRAAFDARGGEDRPTVEDWSWDQIVLPSEVEQELQQLQAVIERPDAARAFGVEPPSGLLLTGPPGTGKTMIARIFAAQARCSFYPVSSADLTSKWLGESEQMIRQLFDRARTNRPSIIFIDELDAIASRRGGWGTYDRQVNELLTAIDGVGSQPGVFVMAATNRIDQLDPAVLRGGRLSRQIEIPLPDLRGRLAMLQLMTRRMPTVDVDLVDLAERSEGRSGADLNALCQQAALQAMVRKRERGDASIAEPVVRHEDFLAALEALRSERDEQPAGR